MRFLVWMYVPIFWGCRADTKAFVEPSNEGQITSDADGDGYLSDEDCDEDDPKRERFYTALAAPRKSYILDRRICKQSPLVVFELLSTRNVLLLCTYTVLQTA